MEKHEQFIAQFTVSITGAENRTWQGTVTVEDGIFRFESEMELLHGLLERYPALLTERPEWKD